MLRFQVFEYRFDNQIALRQIVDLSRGDPVLHNGIDLRSRELALLHGFGEKALGLFARFFQRVGSRIEHDGAKPRTRRDDRDARAHGATPSDADCFDVHIIFR